jgi:integrase
MGEEYLWLFCQFIIYTLARPVELIKIKVEHFDMADDRIHIPCENAKGRSGEWIDRYPPLKELILQHNIHKAPMDSFVFSSDQNRDQRRWERITFISVMESCWKRQDWIILIWNIPCTAISIVAIAIFIWQGSFYFTRFSSFPLNTRGLDLDKLHIILYIRY